MKLFCNTEYFCFICYTHIDVLISKNVIYHKDNDRSILFKSKKYWNCLANFRNHVKIATKTQLKTDFLTKTLS